MSYFDFIKRCWNNGVCTIYAGTTLCSCLSGTYGPTCREKSNCQGNNPCKNGATCIFVFGKTEYNLKYLLNIV